MCSATSLLQLDSKYENLSACLSLFLSVLCQGVHVELVHACVVASDAFNTKVCHETFKISADFVLETGYFFCFLKSSHSVHAWEASVTEHGYLRY